MAVVLEQEKLDVLDTGIYRARVNSIEADEGQFGPQVKFEFEILDEPYADRTLVGWCSAKFSVRTKLFKWTRGILGRRIQVDERFDSDKLVGRECRLSVTIKIRADDGTEFNKIDEVLEAIVKDRTETPKPATTNGHWSHNPDTVAAMLTKAKEQFDLDQVDVLKALQVEDPRDFEGSKGVAWKMITAFAQSNGEEVPW
jgi:hypothetical protein